MEILFQKQKLQTKGLGCGSSSKMLAWHAWDPGFNPPEPSPHTYKIILSQESFAFCLTLLLIYNVNHLVLVYSSHVPRGWGSLKVCPYEEGVFYFWHCLELLGHRNNKKKSDFWPVLLLLFKIFLQTKTKERKPSLWPTRWVESLTLLFSPHTP
jgi:hypothetical protein